MKVGAGTLTLSGPASYFAGTVVEEGVLQSVGGGLGGPVPTGLSVRSGATFRALSDEVVSSLDGAGSIEIGSHILELQGGGGYAFQDGVISGTGSVRKINDQVQGLYGMNSFSGGLFIRGSKYDGVEVPSFGNAGEDGPLGRGSVTIGDASGPGALHLYSTGGSTSNRPFTLGFAGWFDIINGNSSVTLNGLLNGTGILAKDGLGELILTNAQNSFPGLVMIEKGVLSAPSIGASNAAGPLGAGNSILFGAPNLSEFGSGPGTFKLTTTGAQTTDRQFVMQEGGGILDLPAGSTLILTHATSGSGSMRKTGGGTLILEANAAHTGPTYVSDGVFSLQANMVGDVAVQNGTLETSGGASRTVGALSLSGGMISPGGVAVGGLNSGSLSLSGGTLRLDLASASLYDSLQLTGSVTFSGQVELAIVLGFHPVNFQDVFRIIVNDQTDAPSFADANARFSYQGQLLADGDQFLVESGAVSQLFAIDYGTNGGDNDIRIAAVPEPCGCAFIVLGLLAVTQLRKRA